MKSGKLASMLCIRTKYVGPAIQPLIKKKLPNKYSYQGTTKKPSLVQMKIISPDLMHILYCPCLHTNSPPTPKAQVLV